MDRYTHTRTRMFACTTRMLTCRHIDRRADTHTHTHTHMSGHRGYIGRICARACVCVCVCTCVMYVHVCACVM